MTAGIVWHIITRSIRRMRLKSIFYVIVDSLENKSCVWVELGFEGVGFEFYILD